MTDQNASRSERVVPWELRVCAAIPLPPFAAGAVIAALLVIAVMALNSLLGVPLVFHDAGGKSVLAREFRSAIIVSMLIGYTMAAGRYLAAAIVRDLRASGRIDRDASSLGGALADLDYDRGVVVASRTAGLAGVVAITLLIMVVYPYLTGSASLSVRPDLVWSMVLTPLLGFLLARAAYNSASGIRSPGDNRVPGSGGGAIDLLNLDAYYVDGRIGLRLALVWIVGSSIASLFFFDPDLIVAVAPLLLVGLGLAFAVFTLPVRRLHLNIRAAKKQELAAVRERIRAARDASMQGDSAQGGRLADLLGYQSYLEGLREWPFDNTTMARFFLYLLIPIGSWLGGALVERMLASWLD
jgi:hypothetical protein